MALTFEAVPEPRYGLVTLVPDTGSQLTLVIAEDPDQALPVGGWETSERLGLPAARWWKAPSESTLTLDLAIDTRLVGGPDMARRLQVLEQMGTRAAGAPEPPKVKVVGGHLPRAATRIWVLQRLALGTRVTAAGEHVRQQVTVSLEQFVNAPTIEPVNIGRTRTTSGKRRRRVIQAKTGDTLRRIAVRQLGSVSEWKALRDWNPALKNVDPDAPLRTGTRVVLK